jgi:hypothetical protein
MFAVVGGLRNPAVQKRMPGIRPESADDFRRADDARDVERGGRACNGAGQIRRNDFDVVMTERDDVASRVP